MKGQNIPPILTAIALGSPVVIAGVLLGMGLLWFLTEDTPEKKAARDGKVVPTPTGTAEPQETVPTPSKRRPPGWKENDA